MERPSCLYFVSVYHTDGSRILTTHGNTAAVLNTRDGTVVSTLHGHTVLMVHQYLGMSVACPHTTTHAQATIYCADWSDDGQRLVTGGADRQAVVWSATGDPMHKIHHADSVQAVVFSPATSSLLATVAGTELMLMNKDNKSNGQRVKVCLLLWGGGGRYTVLHGCMYMWCG